MKKQIIILGLNFILTGFIPVLGYDNYYPQSIYYGNINQNKYHLHNPHYARYNNTYCPYCGAKNFNSYYINPHNANVVKIRRLHKIKKIKNKKNKISWIFNNNNGSMTGYSLPVNKNILNNNFPNKKTRQINSSPTCNTQLWGYGDGDSGNNSSMLSKEKYNLNKQTGAKTGVTIIYD